MSLIAAALKSQNISRTIENLRYNCVFHLSNSVLKYVFGKHEHPPPPFSEKLYFTHNFISDLISCSLKVTFTNDYCCNLKLFCLFYEHEFFICENGEEKLTKKKWKTFSLLVVLWNEWILYDDSKSCKKCRPLLWEMLLFLCSQ